MCIDMFIAATTATVAGDNSLSDKWTEESKYARRVSRIALAGSAVIGDVYFTLKYGNRTIAKVLPSTIGAVKPLDDDMQTLSGKLVCPANVPMALIASGPAVTNSVYCVIEFQEIVRGSFRSFGYQRGYRGRSY